MEAEHQNAPKKPMTAYLYFFNEHRAVILRENPEKGLIDIAKECGKRWAQFSEQERAPYLELAEQDKARYKEELERFKDSSTN